VVPKLIIDTDKLTEFLSAMRSQAGCEPGRHTALFAALNRNSVRVSVVVCESEKNNAGSHVRGDFSLDLTSIYPSSIYKIILTSYEHSNYLS